MRPTRDGEGQEGGPGSIGGSWAPPHTPCTWSMAQSHRTLPPTYLGSVLRSSQQVVGCLPPEDVQVTRGGEKRGETDGRKTLSEVLKIVCVGGRGQQGAGWGMRQRAVQFRAWPAGKGRGTPRRWSPALRPVETASYRALLWGPSQFLTGFRWNVGSEARFSAKPKHRWQCWEVARGRAGTPRPLLRSGRADPGGSVQGTRGPITAARIS